MWSSGGHISDPFNPFLRNEHVKTSSFIWKDQFAGTILELYFKEPKIIPKNCEFEIDANEDGMPANKHTIVYVGRRDLAKNHDSLRN
jgi:hypothetical protein